MNPGRQIFVREREGKEGILREEKVSSRVGLHNKSVDRQQRKGKKPRASYHFSRSSWFFSVRIYAWLIRLDMISEIGHFFGWYEAF